MNPARHTADLLIKAGADQHQIPRWDRGRPPTRLPAPPKARHEITAWEQSGCTIVLVGWGRPGAGVRAVALPSQQGLRVDPPGSREMACARHESSHN